jgi:hypothetical protein
MSEININYDYVIIGGGPTGLTLSYLISKFSNKKILLIDRNDSLGGCNRVKRVNGLFTEHAPRILSSSYLNLMHILDLINQDVKLIPNLTNYLKTLNIPEFTFSNLFTPYNFNLSSIGGKSISSFKINELFLLFLEFIKLIFNNNHGKNISINEFMKNHNFSSTSLDYTNRLCRLTDGAGSDSYTLYEFLQLANQQILYTIYQPKYPNDILLFKIWNDILISLNVDIKLNTNITKIVGNNNKITNIEIIENNINYNISVNNVIFCIPPEDIFTILQNSNIQNFPLSNNKISDLNWVNTNKYITDISVIFHWDTKLQLKKIWGFPSSKWGVYFVISTDYTNMNNPNSLTVISTTITIKNVLGYNNKLVDDCTEDEIKDEVFLQLKDSFPNLIKPTYVILNPNVYRSIDGKYKDNDTAYMMSNPIHLQNIHSIYSNLFNCGTQNGDSIYAFTSFESATQNAISFYNKIINNKEKIKIRKLVTIINLIKSFFIILFLILIFIIIYKKFKNYKKV